MMRADGVWGWRFWRVGCAPEVEPDAYGNVEAIDVVVSAETERPAGHARRDRGRSAGREGAAVGAIDAVQLELERDRIVAERSANQSRVGEIGRQIEALMSQRDAADSRRASLDSERRIAERTYERIKRLYDQQAATAPELDRAEREYRTLVDQTRAQEQEVTGRAQQVEAARAQQQTAQAAGRWPPSRRSRSDDDRIRRSQIVNPVAGTVLTVYARAGEFLQPGQPLYKIANLADRGCARLCRRARPGSRARRRARAGHASTRAPAPAATVPGTIVWVSSEAEFTPTPIQTRQQRVGPGLCDQGAGRQRGRHAEDRHAGRPTAPGARRAGIVSTSMTPGIRSSSIGWSSALERPPPLPT